MDAVLFDLDGTLWDSVAQLTPAWNRVLSAYGVSATEQRLRSMMGKTAAYFAAALLPQLPPEEGLAVVDRCCQEELIDLLQTGGVLYPRLRETLELLRRRCRLMIVSNCQAGYIETFLQAHQLGDLFSDFELHGRTGLSKGENIRLVLRRGAITRAVYVGDTLGDQEAAEQAGIPFIHAAYGFGQATRCAARLSAFDELPGALDALWAK